MIKVFSKLLLSTIVFSSLSLFAQQNNTSDPEARDRELFRTFGWCYGQQRSLDQIRAEFPSLNLELFKAESEFAVTFGKSCKSLYDVLGKATTDAFIVKLNQMLPKGPLSDSVARAFLSKVSGRAKGEIESPVKETLLAFNPDFLKQPAFEFNRGFTSLYSTKNHAKAKGIHLELRVPMSWMAREGNRPNIVQFFKGQYGRSNTSMLIAVHDLPPPPKGVRVTQKDYDEMFLPQNLKEHLSEEMKLIEGKPVTLDGRKGAMLVYDATASRLDQTVTMRTMRFVTSIKGKLIGVEFSTSGFQGEQAEVQAEFARHRALFMLIANSIILMDTYQ